MYAIRDWRMDRRPMLCEACGHPYVMDSIQDGERLISAHVTACDCSPAREVSRPAPRPEPESAPI